MRCPRCGVENPEGKIVCRACGARLRPRGAAAAAAPRETEGELRRWVAYDLTRILWVAGVVIAVGLGLGFLVR
ncbi:MAG TPA: zinc-ribbon domain-containing protein [bacterium]|nr:zinc-ribbon domain-containing protein [bacterium]